MRVKIQIVKMNQTTGFHSPPHYIFAIPLQL